MIAINASTAAIPKLTSHIALVQASHRSLSRLYVHTPLFAFGGLSLALLSGLFDRLSARIGVRRRVVSPILIACPFQIVFLRIARDYRTKAAREALANSLCDRIFKRHALGIMRSKPRVCSIFPDTALLFAYRVAQASRANSSFFFGLTAMLTSQSDTRRSLTMITRVKTGSILSGSPLFAIKVPQWKYS